MLNQTEDRIRATGRARAAACAAGLLIWVAGAATPTSTASSTQDGTYRWNGELVALDEGAGTLTVKARFLSPAVPAASDGLRAGDAIFLTWSGFGNRASGIWSLARDEGSPSATEPEDGGARFPLRAAFEAIDADTRYLTFRVPLPEASRSAVRSLTRGAWVRLTSPRHPADAPALLAVEAYAAARGQRPAALARDATYRWGGELVALDEASEVLTVRARMVSAAARSAAAGLAAGAPIVITWSGYGHEASGIRGVAADDGSGLWGGDRYLLRATFEAVEAAGRQLRFRVPLPEASRAAVRSLTRGAWARMTSPHHPADAPVLLAVDAYAPARGPRPAALARDATYRWGGELVALDEASDALTVRARMVSAAARSAAAGLAAGEPIVITWSGYGHEASGIRAVAADDDSGLWGSDRYLLRAAFEAVEAAGRQLRFRVPLPEASRSAVRSLTRGAWARMTSPHHPADARPALLAVNAYAPARGRRPAALAQDATYRWGGELVALDEASDALTVRARMVSAAARSAAAGLAAGEPIVITWSGYGHEASGIRGVAADDGSGLWGSDRYLLRATLEAVEAGGRQLRFRVPLPEASRAAVRSLTRGAWARMTSPHHPAGARPALLAVNAYAPARGRRPAALAQDATYRWGGELVALDEASGALAVRAQMVSAAARSAAAGLAAGEPIVITWSGYGHEASGIRGVAADDGSGLWGSDRYLLRATFEAVEAAGRQLRFRVPLPEASRGTARLLAPGAWARMTSPHHPADARPALLAVNAYAPPRATRRAAAGGEKTYVWPGELVALHAGEQAVSVSSPVERHVFRYVERFGPGDGVVLLWAPGDGREVTAVRYLQHRGPDDGVPPALDHGYVLPAEFIAADERSRRITFKARVPESTFDALTGIQPGQWVKVTALFDQRGRDGAVVLAVERDGDQDAQAQE